MKGRALQRSKQLLGDGLLTSEGELWRSQRRLVQPAFHADMLDTYARQMVAARPRRASTGRGATARGRLDREMAALTLSIVGEALFGTDLQRRRRRVSARARHDGRPVPAHASCPAPSCSTCSRPREPSRPACRARPGGLVDRLVDRRRDDACAVTTATCSACCSPRGMPDQQVRDEVMTLLLAGHETTANALTWSWFLLSRHRGRAGPDARRGRPGPRPVATRSRPTSTAPAVHRAVLAEAMRLYPPAWSLGRRLVADVVRSTAGRSRPARSSSRRSGCCTATRGSGRTRTGSSPDAGWTPTALRRERARATAGAWFPFGLGQRVCVGESFAWLEGVLVLASIAQRWLVDVDPAFEPVVQPAVTLRPAGTRRRRGTAALA